SSASSASATSSQALPRKSQNQFGSRDSNPDSWLQRPSLTRGVSNTYPQIWAKPGKSEPASLRAVITKLRAAQKDKDDERALVAADALAEVFLGSAEVKLATEVRKHGPHTFARAND